MAKNRALIFGMSGQDGSYMTDMLASKGYEVYGTIHRNRPSRIWTSGIFDKRIKEAHGNVLHMDIPRMLKDVQPTEIYNFAGVSDVFDPWKDVAYTFELNTLFPQRIIQSILEADRNIKFFQASSCLIFGRDESRTQFQDENTKPNPIHPYGISKLAADNLIKEARKVFGIYACSGIFFNHNSWRQKTSFFCKKMTDAARRAKRGEKFKLKIGNLSARRDYGYAPDFMEAAYLMMHNKQPTDYVIGTGNLISMDEFARKCFDYVGLNYKDYLEEDDKEIRQNDTNVLRANITKITYELGWKPKHSVDDMIKIMIDSA